MGCGASKRRCEENVLTKDALAYLDEKDNNSTTSTGSSRVAHEDEADIKKRAAEFCLTPTHGDMSFVIQLDSPKPLKLPDTAAAQDGMESEQDLWKEFDVEAKRRKSRSVPATEPSSSTVARRTDLIVRHAFTVHGVTSDPDQYLEEMQPCENTLAPRQMGHIRAWCDEVQLALPLSPLEEDEFVDEGESSIMRGSLPQFGFSVTSQQSTAESASVGVMVMSTTSTADDSVTERKPTNAGSVRVSYILDG